MSFYLSYIMTWSGLIFQCELLRPNGYFIYYYLNGQSYNIQIKWVNCLGLRVRHCKIHYQKNEDIIRTFRNCISSFYKFFLLSNSISGQSVSVLLQNSPHAKLNIKLQNQQIDFRRRRGCCLVDLWSRLWPSLIWENCLNMS